ncbi:lipoprotein [Actinomycetospora corticicola]|uniref:Uncharacterized protein n=1 Tax=Actinomycetospora corticicola TaxID=663602 RepID=A0A7Y9DY77_9PSEU|nr:hypothetical protein [Actinomycetospora corticicola]NYD37531.1 hypothetical protein [Actinomycetospora corticicola]
MAITRDRPHPCPSGTGGRRRRTGVAVAALVVTAGLLAGCGSPGTASTPAATPTPSSTATSEPAATPLAEAPEPAVSPPARASLPGTVIPLAGAPEGIAVTAAGTVAVNVRNPDGLDILPITPGGQGPTTTTPRFVPLRSEGRHLTLAGPDGPALSAGEKDGTLSVIDLPSGQIDDTVPTTGPAPHEAFAVGEGTIFVANEFGNSFSIIRDRRVVRTVPTPLQPGGGAATSDGRYAVGVGVRGRQITEYTATGDTVGTANCGAGPTHTVAGDDGLFWVNDTNGDAVLGFEATPTGPRQVATIPTGAGSKPYGDAYDTARHTLWVTLTGTDELLGLTLSGTQVQHQVSIPTVRQPNSVAVDPTTGETVTTGSTTNGQLQFVPYPEALR